jgi:hypothetical protein
MQMLLIRTSRPGDVFHQSENEIKLEENQENKIGDTLILLDSQSTHNTFYVRRLVQNIRDAPRPLKMGVQFYIHNKQTYQDMEQYGLMKTP